MHSIHTHTQNRLLPLKTGVPRSSSREVRLRVPLFLQSILVGVSPPNQKRGEKGGGPVFGSSTKPVFEGVEGCSTTKNKCAPEERA